MVNMSPHSSGSPPLDFASRELPQVLSRSDGQIMSRATVIAVGTNLETGSSWGVAGRREDRHARNSPH